jgi:hypothetical protein
MLALHLDNQRNMGYSILGETPKSALASQLTQVAVTFFMFSIAWWTEKSRSIIRTFGRLNQFMCSHFVGNR